MKQGEKMKRGWRVQRKDKRGGKNTQWVVGKNTPIIAPKVMPKTIPTKNRFKLLGEEEEDKDSIKIIQNTPKAKKQNGQKKKLRRRKVRRREISNSYDNKEKEICTTVRIKEKM